jgi:hypothetical protein
VDGNTALLTIRRDSPQDVGYRQVIFSLDDQRIGQLLYGRTLSREVAAGHHRLKANNTLFWKTVEFNAEPGDHIRFRVTNYARTGFYFILGLFGAAPLFLKIEREP